MALLQPLTAFKKTSLPPSIQAESIVDLVERNIEPPPAYIEPAILPVGGQLILGAHAKTGKSFTLLEYARALSTGTTPFDCPLMSIAAPARVLLVEGELGEYGLQLRAEKILAGTGLEELSRMRDNFLYVSKVPELRLDESRGRSILYDLCEQTQPNVLIIDPIGRFHNYDENNAQEISKLWSHLDEIQKLFTHNGMALIMCQHMGKPKDKRFEADPLSPYEMRGSSKWFDNPDSIMTLERTHNLATPHQAWSLGVRFTLRHGGELGDDMIFHVNEKDDGRVRYFKNKGAVGKLFTLDSKKKEGPVQAGFLPG